MILSIPKAPPRAPTPRPKIIAGALSAARLTAQRKGRAILERQQLSPIKSWAEFESVHGVRVSPTFKETPISFMAVMDFVKDYELSAEARLEVALDNIPHHVQPTKMDLENIVLNNFTLRPRQRKAATQCINVLFKSRSTNAALLPMPTGSGKTIVCAAIIKYIQDHDYFGREKEDYAIIYLTPKNVVIKTIRAFTKAGLKDLGTCVQVMAYSELRTQTMSAFFVDQVVPVGETSVTIKRWRWAKPVMVFLDECHYVANRSTLTAKYVQAWIGPDTTWMFASATPIEKLADAYIYTLAAQLKFSGEPVTRDNVNYVLKAVGQCSPDRLNNAAIGRFKDWLGDACVNPPADPSKVKAYNGVKLVDFKSPESEERYRAAEEVMIETWNRLGKVVSGRGEMLAAMTAFQRAEEYEKADQFADLADDAIQRGKAPVIGVKFIGTVKRFMMIMAQKGYTRSQITVVMGGEKEIKESEVYTPDEFLQVHRCVCNDEAYLDSLPRKEATKYRKSVVYHRERWKNMETEAEQQERDRWLKTMKLYKQDYVQRQDEIDNFQEGRTICAIFTLPSGGVGVDFDQQIETVRPREMFSTLCWSGREFVQAFGRCKREFTLTDVYQWAVFFRNTIVANAIAPRLSKKLGNINRLGSSGINLEEELLSAIDNLPPNEVIEGPVADDGVVKEIDDDDDDDE